LGNSNRVIIKVFGNRSYCSKTINAHDDWIRGVDISPDAKLLASCSNDQVKPCPVSYVEFETVGSTKWRE
jgi:WD40 repeat protein